MLCYMQCCITRDDAYGTWHADATRAGVPPLVKWQQYSRSVKKARKAGVTVESVQDMNLWAAQHYLPEDWKDVEPFVVYAVEYEGFDAVDAVVLTMREQMLWLEQCIKSRHKTMVHMDGKYKLHHGGWLLITFGCHCLRYDKKKGRVTHSFRPFVYMFVRQKESGPSIQLGLHCCNLICLRYFEGPYEPGCGVADHGQGMDCEPVNEM